MTVNIKSSLMVGLSGLALITLAACGGGQSAPAETTSNPVEVETSAVPEPTITPNADPIETTHPNSIQPETTLSISAEGSVNREPDIAFLNAGVQTQGSTAQEAMTANSASG